MTASPDQAAVGVSIVIPAWRLADELGRCLDAIAGQESQVGHEVVVVVNGSDPGVLAAATTHPSRPTVVPLTENLGFGRACNIGALRARGQYLVFLNDDAVAQPGWLQALVDAAEESGAAAVSSVLLDPSGTIAEAGARIGPGAEPWPIAAGLTIEEATAQGLLEPRPLVYGSGAALLVRKDRFVEAGGFDDAYAPAYYEDVDLQLRLQSAGHQVLLAPAARVTHGASSSTADRPHFRQFASEHAVAVFRERWGDVLATAPSPDDDPTALLQVPRRPGTRAPLTEAPADDASVSALAFATQRLYVAWLEEFPGRVAEDLISRHAAQVADLERQLVHWRVKALRGWDAAADGAPTFTESADTVERLLHEAEAARQDARALRATLSWRITAPLRGGVSVARKVRSLARGGGSR